MIPGLEFAPKNGDKSVYERRLHGNERMTAAIAEHAEGFGHIFMGFHAAFKDINKKDLLRATEDAWIQTRFSAPWVATRTLTLEGPGVEPNSWIQTYDTGAEAAKRWAKDIVFWRDESLVLSDWEEKLKSQFWRPSSGRFGLECHLAKAPSDGYYIMFSIGHWLADARGILALFDLFFQNLRAEIRATQDPITSILWGQELPRLSPAVIKALDLSSTKDSAPQPPSAPASVPITFLRPLSETTNWEGRPSMKASISLSQSDTTAFHKLCKAHKANITAVLNSVHIIADVKTALRLSAGSTKFDEVLKAFEHSDIYPVYTNVADRRKLLSERLPAVKAPAGFGNVVNDNFPTFHSMDLVRNCVKVSPVTRAVNSSLTKSDFWNGLVSQTQQFMKTNGQSNPDLFFSNESAVDAAVASFDPATVAIPGIMCSSIGSMALLKLFDSFRPAATLSDLQSPFSILELNIAVRATRVTAVVAVMWEYDGRLEIHLQGSPRWHSDEAWEIFVSEVEDAISQLLIEREDVEVGGQPML